MDPTPLRLGSKLPSLATPPLKGRGFIAAALALTLAAPAHADTLVDNVNGITLDKDGKLVRFTGLVIDSQGKVKQLLDRKDKRRAKLTAKERQQRHRAKKKILAHPAMHLGKS